MNRAFRLAGLLRLRTLQEEQAAAVLGASHAALRQAHERRQASVAAFAEHAVPGGASDTQSWRAVVARRTVLQDHLADAGVAVTHAEERVAVDTAGWSAARSRSLGLEKLRDKHRALVGLQDARAEQHALDEVAARTAAQPPVRSTRSATHRLR